MGRRNAYTTAKHEAATVAADCNSTSIAMNLTENIKACESKSLVRSRTDEFEFQITRGWLDADMAAAYLGVKVKTVYNLKSKALLKSNGNRKLGFNLKDLDQVLEGMK